MRIKCKVQWHEIKCFINICQPTVWPQFMHSGPLDDFFGKYTESTEMAELLRLAFMMWSLHYVLWCNIDRLNCIRLSIWDFFYFRTNVNEVKFNKYVSICICIDYSWIRCLTRKHFRFDTTVFKALHWFICLKYLKCNSRRFQITHGCITLYYVRLQASRMVELP